MSSLSEQDWERINAYHDGELPDDEMRAFERRLAADTDLADALQKVASLSGSLGALRPDIHAVEQNVEHDSASKQDARGRASRNWMIGGTLAASLMIVGFLGVELLRSETPLDLHLTYLEQEFERPDAGVGQVAARALQGFPDLTGANLVPVASRTYSGGSLAHYSGRNGCRLSYFRGRGAFELPGEADMQVTAWTTADGLHHAIIATGMDAGKFEAIGVYLLHVTRQMPEIEVASSLEQATVTASNCLS